MPSSNKLPNNSAENRVTSVDKLRLRPIQVHVGSPIPENPHRAESVVRRPFPLERFNRPIPHLAVRILLTDGLQLALEILLRDPERGFQVDVVRKHDIFAGFTHHFLSMIHLTQSIRVKSESLFHRHFHHHLLHLPAYSTRR